MTGTHAELPDSLRGLLGGRILVRNTGLNLAGSVIPVLFAVAAIPILVGGLGPERFGLLAIAWALLGSFGIFDLGLGRALTQQVATALGQGATEPLSRMVWTFLALLAVVGLVVGSSFTVLSGWLVDDALNVPGGLSGEAREAFDLLGVGIPLVMVAAGLRGLLEAHQRFGLVNAVRIPSTVLTVAGPVLILPFSTSLVSVVGFLVAVRTASLVAHGLMCIRVVPHSWFRPRPALSLVGAALRATGWMTVTNLINPLMLYPDRFLIGVLLSTTAVSYYAVPHDLATKLLILPIAPIPVLFPAFATSFAADRQRSAELFLRVPRYLLIAILPLVTGLVAFSEELMGVWLGEEFADRSGRVLQLLALGVMFQGVAQVPFAFLQGAGRADLTAKLQLLEVPLYLGGLWLAIGALGIEGAALMWLTRAIVDAVALFVIAWRLLGLPGPEPGTALVCACLVGTVIGLGVVPFGLEAKSVIFILAAAGMGVLTWRRLLSSQERRWLGAQRLALSGLVANRAFLRR